MGFSIPTYGENEGALTYGVFRVLGKGVGRGSSSLKMVIFAVAMRKKETAPILLYSLSDEKVNQIVNDFLDYVSNPYHYWRQTSEWRDKEFLNTFSMRRDMPAPNVEVSPERQPLRRREGFDTRAEKYTLTHKPQRDKTEYKFRALIDMVYRLFASAKEGWFSLNRKVLARVYDEAYPYMITTLSQHDIINWETNTMTIPHPEWFSLEPYRYAASVVPYRDKVNELIRDYNRKQLSDKIAAIDRRTDTFLRQYEHNVGLIQFVDVEGLESYMDNPSHFSEKHENSRLFFQNVVDRISVKNGYTYAEKCFVSMGASEEVNHIGRYYHIATSLPKELKPFTNIQYGVDTHNSHPLLFNFLIFNYFINNSLIDLDFDFISISNSKLFYYISKYLFQTPISQSYHYVLESLCKYLKDNEIIQNVDLVRAIPMDALRYIQDTTTGRIWEKIRQAFPQYSRDEVKENMFRHVYYTYATRTGYYDRREQKYVVMERKKWVDMFKKCYPSVLTLMNRIKKDLHEQCQRRGLIDKKGKDMVQLPHLLMRFESVIFTRALAAAFAERIPAIGIHDCIAVVDNADSIDAVQQQKVVEIIKEQYMNAGLVPSLGVERY